MGHRVERVEQRTHSDAIIRVVVGSSVLRILLEDHSTRFVDHVYGVYHGERYRWEWLARMCHSPVWTCPGYFVQTFKIEPSMDLK